MVAWPGEWRKTVSEGSPWPSCTFAGVGLALTSLCAAISALTSEGGEAGKKLARAHAKQEKHPYLKLNDREPRQPGSRQVACALNSRSNGDRQPLIPFLSFVLLLVAVACVVLSFMGHIYMLVGAAIALGFLLVGFVMEAALSGLREKRTGKTTHSRRRPSEEP